MTSKSLSFFVALVVIMITSFLTSSGNAAAFPAPTPTRFAREPRPNSMPALMTRFNKKRDDADKVHGCTSYPSDAACLLDSGALATCEAGSSNLYDCLMNACPDVNTFVIQCVADTYKTLDDDNQEEIVMDFNMCPVESGDVHAIQTCLKLSFEVCALNNDPAPQYVPQGNTFKSCLILSCQQTGVSNKVLSCISQRYAHFYADELPAPTEYAGPA